MRLVDDEQVVLGQHLAALERVDRHERVVGDDDVAVLGGLARPLDEAVGERRALAAHALVGADRHLPPGALADARDQLVAVAGLGLVGPLAQPHDLLAEPGRRPVDLADVEQPVLVVGEAALQLVGTQVVAATLDQAVGRAACPSSGAIDSASRGMSRSTIWACSARVAVATTAGLPVFWACMTAGIR